MKKGLLTTVASAAVLALSGAAFAEEPVNLSDVQMDGVSAAGGWQGSFIMFINDKDSYDPFVTEAVAVADADLVEPSYEEGGASATFGGITGTATYTSICDACDANGNVIYDTSNFSGSLYDFAYSGSVSVSVEGSIGPILP
jgi:hypothetical protein